MKTIKSEVSYELIINKSTFISNLKNVATIDDAKKYGQIIKETYSDATHNVVAYIIGKTGEYAYCHDDGEPKGTAGMPILDALKKNNLTNIICVVTRYFGGIKLGAGGLVRAYSKATSLAINQAEIIEIIDYLEIELTVPYHLLQIVDHRLQQIEKINTTFHSNHVISKIKIPKNDFENITTIINNISNGQINVQIIK